MAGANGTSAPRHSQSSPSAFDAAASASGLEIPRDLRAEKALVASIMQDPEYAEEQCLEFVTREMFTHQGYASLVETIKDHLQRRKPIDVYTLAENLPEGISAVELAHLMWDTVASGAGVGIHFQKVSNLYKRRVLWEKSQHLTRSVRGANGVVDIDEITYEIRRTLDKVDGIGLLSEIEAIQDIVPRAVSEIRPASERMKDHVISTGFPCFDEMLVGGLRKGHFYILAARPSVGKTTLAMNVALNMAAQDFPALVISLETRKETLTQSLLARLSGVNGYHLIKGTYDEAGAQAISQAAQQLERIPLHICDDTRITMSGLKSMVRRAKRQCGIKAVFIDYLQLLQSDLKHEGRVAQVSAISRECKQLSLEEDIPVVALSQLSRKTESREDKRPMLSDLRESGSIEQDADVVALMYRSDYYDGNQDLAITEINVGKQRHGPTGTIQLYFNKRIQEFTDPEDGGVD